MIVTQAFKELLERALVVVEAHGEEYPLARPVADELRAAIATLEVAPESSLRPCECGCGVLVEGGLMEVAHPEDFRDERG